MNTKSLKRVIVGVGAASLLATVMVVPVTAAPPGGTSRDIRIDGSAVGMIDNFTISAGESAVFPITVTNAGKQTVNGITLKFGADDNILKAGNGDATPPSELPAGVFVNADGCSGGSILSCDIGTLGAKKYKTFTVTVSTTVDTAATLDVAPYFDGRIATEAVVSVAEGGGDAGSNQDTFGAQGWLQVIGYSCDAVAAYRPGGGQFVSTPCDVSQSNKQQSSVKLPAGRSSISITEGTATAPIVSCPTVSGLSCIGNAVFADITDEASGDLVSWQIRYDVTGLNVNTSKLVVYHYLNDGTTLSPAGGISLAKKNACSAKNPVNCGSASIDSQTNILTITFITNGNGKTRLLG